MDRSNGPILSDFPVKAFIFDIPVFKKGETTQTV